MTAFTLSLEREPFIPVNEDVFKVDPRDVDEPGTCKSGLEVLWPHPFVLGMFKAHCLALISDSELCPSPYDRVHMVTEPAPRLAP